MRTFVVFFIAIVAILRGGIASADLPLDSSEWSLRQEREGISIYTKALPDSDYYAFKARAILNVPLENIMAVMAQPSSCMEWVHGCIESWGLREDSFNKRYAYSVNDLPWPVRDRDYVLEINTKNDPEAGTITMDMYAVDHVLPPKDEFIRMTRQETHYIFKAVSSERTEMIWLQHTDPSGHIPSWLVNALIVDIPFNSMKRLEAVAQLPKYTNATILFDDNQHIIGVKSQSVEAAAQP